MNTARSMIHHGSPLRAADVAHTLGGKRYGNGYIARCPAHDDRHPSLSIREDNDRLLMHCFAGCDWQAIYQALKVDGVIPYGEDPHRILYEESPLPHNERKRQRAEQLWRQSIPVSSGDPVSAYLRNRRIQLERFPDALRYHPSLQYWEAQRNDGFVLKGEYPAMVARVDDANGAFLTVHRTYLAKDGTKAAVASVKKLMPAATSIKGGAIRLHPCTTRLGVAEGIETALSCAQVTELPVWSAITAGGLSSLAVPKSVQELIIFADNDASGTGAKAANQLASRLISENVTVKILMPPVAGMDWLDAVAEVPHEQT